jgi:renalase
MPDPQARRLVDDHPVARTLDREWEPVIAVAARWADRAWDLDGVFVNGDPDLGWIADDGRRRGDGAPVLVAHTTPALAARHLQDPAGVVPDTVGALRRLLDLGEPEDVHVHRWTYARPVGERTEPFALVDGDRLVGVCGDGWGATPKVETAWLSGVRLGRALVERLR